MLTKPCARSLSHACPGLITAKGPKGLARRTWCSVSCAIQARLDAGWQPHATLTPENRSKGGVQGGKIAGLHRRKHVMQQAAKHLERHLTPDLLEALSVPQAARIKVLLARAYRVGHRTGYRAGYAAKTYRARVSRKAAA